VLPFDASLTSISFCFGFAGTGDKRIAVEGKGQCLDLTDGRLDNSVQ